MENILFDKVAIDDLVSGKRIVLQRGAATRYEFVITQTGRQKMAGDVTVAYVSVAKGSAFSVSGDQMLAAWRRIKDKPLSEQLDDFQVVWLSECMTKGTANVWTQRAMVEAVGRFMEWETA